MRIAPPLYLPHEITRAQYIDAFCAQYPQWEEYVRSIDNPNLIPGTETEFVLREIQDDDQRIKFEKRTALVFHSIYLL